MERTTKYTPVLVCLLALFSVSGVLAGQKSGLSKLAGTFSQKRLVETAADHGGSLLFRKSSADTDFIHLIAFRVEFETDTNPQTTGDGHFGMLHDPKEQKYYADTNYRYDHLPHNSTYFRNQLEFVKNYFATVSRGRLKIDYSLFPSDLDTMFNVGRQISYYSAGFKRKDQSYNEYYSTKQVGLMKFVRDAIQKSDIKNGPFAGLRDSGGSIVDSLGHKTVFMIIHAGSSFLTDGGTTGEKDSPSDFIDAFIDHQLFDYYKDTLKLKTVGIPVRDSSYVIDEIMMCSETSNQDGLNWGIHGVMVNQVARQLGVPDLFSTSSGMTAIGGFCIMDFYGYSVANGFIPPWPSAWVRAFMGWDTPKVVPIGQTSACRVKAISASQPSDTTILLIPLNDHEYYLIENRQRNLSATPDFFTWDTAKGPPDTVFIDPISPVNLKSKSLIDTVSQDNSRAILHVKNYDAGIPASGILVWHIDENIIRDRLKFDQLNADSTFKAVSLEEADGVVDLGIQFTNIFYQAVFDFGGAEDVFPHITEKPSGSVIVNSMGPWTRPATTTNDDGQTYLSLAFNPVSANTKQIEVSKIRDYYVKNYSDSAFLVLVSWDYLVKGWPKRTVSEKLFDPAVFGGGRTKKIAVLSQSGKLYAWSAGGAPCKEAADSVLLPYVNVRGDANAPGAYPSSLPADSVHSEFSYFYTIPGSFTFPTSINGKLLVPARGKRLCVVTDPTDTTIAVDSTGRLPAEPSTYLCKLPGKRWAIGTDSGTVLLGDTGAYDRTVATVQCLTNSKVCAIAALPLRPDSFACIQSDCSLSVCSASKAQVEKSVFVQKGIAPFSLVCADLDNDGMPEIVVSDSRKGIWVYRADLTLEPGWEKSPIDSASGLNYADRSKLPENLAPPSLADVNGDGFLDIIAGGNTGVYVFNYKGVMTARWLLDNRYWRGHVRCSPVVTKPKNAAEGPLVIFNSPTGSRSTWEIDSLISYNRSTGIVVYRKFDNTLDTLLDVTSAFIDTLLALGDSAYIALTSLPGGYVDAVNAGGKRPLRVDGPTPLSSRWPLTVGGAIGTSPLLDDFDNDGLINLFAIAANGWVYRWKLGNDVIGDTIVWKQLGYDGSRPFAYLGAAPRARVSETAPITFFSYPNPTNGSGVVEFRYKFSAPASNVRLDIYTMSGLHVLSKTGLSGSFPDYNRLPAVPLAPFGSGVYRCRLEADVGGAKHVQYWKMAVVK
jgi:M6 family metalloprotease-like protein